MQVVIFTTMSAHKKKGGEKKPDKYDVPLKIDMPFEEAMKKIMSDSDKKAKEKKSKK